MNSLFLTRLYKVNILVMDFDLATKSFTCDIDIKN